MREVKYGVFAALPMSLHETASKTHDDARPDEEDGDRAGFDAKPVGSDHDCEGCGRFGALGVGSDFLRVLALLSISLGVLNLLPIPILDGGHVMFCLAEIVMRTTGAGSGAGMGNADRPRDRRGNDAARVL